MSHPAEDDAPADFAVVQVYGDGRPVVVVCLRCLWQSGKGDRASLLGPNGPARQHDRDKHSEPRHNHNSLGVYPNCPACGTVIPPEEGR